MAMAYSEDLRIRAIDLVKTGMSISQVSRLLKISRPTLYRSIEQFEKTGLTAPSQSLQPPQIGKIKDWKKFQEFVEMNGDQTHA